MNKLYKVILPIQLICALLLSAGYVMNIFHAINSTELNNLEVLRIVGVIMAPVGGVLGWLI